MHAVYIQEGDICNPLLLSASSAARTRMRIVLLSAAESLPPLGHILYQPTLHRQAIAIHSVLRNRLPMSPLPRLVGRDFTFIVPVSQGIPQVTVEDQVQMRLQIGCISLSSMHILSSAD